MLFRHGSKSKRGREMPDFLRSLRAITALGVCAIVFIATAAFAIAGSGPSGDGDTPTLSGLRPLGADNEANEAQLAFQRDNAFVSRRTAGSTPLDLAQAGELRGKAAKAAKKLRKEGIPSGPTTFVGAWAQLGP